MGRESELSGGKVNEMKGEMHFAMASHSKSEHLMNLLDPWKPALDDQKGRDFYAKDNYGGDQRSEEYTGGLVLDLLRLPFPTTKSTAQVRGDGHHGGGGRHFLGWCSQK